MKKLSHYDMRDPPLEITMSQVLDLIYVVLPMVIITAVLFSFIGCATDSDARNSRGCYNQVAHSWCKK
jgi:hypothetical protein